MKNAVRKKYVGFPTDIVLIIHCIDGEITLLIDSDVHFSYNQRAVKRLGSEILTAHFFVWDTLKERNHNLL